MNEVENKTQMRGIAAALTAALLWGLIPLYIALIDTDDPFEIVAHRALWSGAFLTLYVWKFTGFQTVMAALAKPGAWFGMLICCVMLVTNWIIFVYAVQSGQVVDAAFGYFIYPLVAVLLGIIVLGERLNKWGWAAIGFVLAGVLVKGLLIGGLPWLALLLAVTFGLYSITRKKFYIDPLHGLFVETIILIGPALGYMLWLHHTGQPQFFGGGAFHVFLAVAFGLVTIVPLLLFHIGNRDLKIIMSSLLFYANPTTQLLLGIYIFGADFSILDLSAFGLIWAGVIVYFSSRPTQNSRQKAAASNRS